ncbi:MAG: DUF4258 domain-containing protein [Chloroflexi bacterium]|nr:DUF4258 domain-containing protein [Chloroflexota bacterium]
MRWRLSRHAQKEIQRRAIPVHLLQSVLERPQHIVPARSGRKAYQSQLRFDGDRLFLVRAIVNDTVDPPMVVTVYRTSKIARYWRTS